MWKTEGEIPAFAGMTGGLTKGKTPADVAEVLRMLYARVMNYSFLDFFNQSTFFVIKR